MRKLIESTLASTAAQLFLNSQLPTSRYSRRVSSCR